MEGCRLPRYELQIWENNRIRTVMRLRPKIPLSANIRTYAKMKIESIGSHKLHKLDDIISPFKVILERWATKKINICPAHHMRAVPLNKKSNLSFNWLMTVPKYICLDNICTAFLAFCNQIRPHLHTNFSETRIHAISKKQEIVKEI